MSRVLTPTSAPAPAAPSPATPTTESPRPAARAGHSLGELPIQAAGLVERAKGAYARARHTQKRIAANPTFRKARAIAGVLGLAGGLETGPGKRGAEARGAFADRWESYFSKLPPEQQAAAREHFPVKAGPEAPPPLPRSRGNEDRDASPGDIEMTDLSSHRGGDDSPFPPNRFAND
jgi:hypothetical protein